MILRIVLGRFAAGTDAAALAGLREPLGRAARAIAGLESVIVGVRPAGGPGGGPVHAEAGPPEGAVVSVWRDVESMRRAGADDEHDRVITDRLGLPFRPSTAHHYELIDRAFGALPPEAVAMLRILTIRARLNEEARLLEILRGRQPRMIDRGLVGSQLARRVIAGGEVEAVITALWPDRSTMAEAAGADALTALPDPEDVAAWRDRLTIEPYDAVEIAPRLPVASGPPLFIVDGDLRIVDITATAAAVLGMPAEDVVGRRVEEMSLTSPEQREILWRRLLADGTVSAETAWRVPEVGTVQLRFVARRDVPIEGRHAVLVRRRLDPAPTLEDLDAAVHEAFGTMPGR